MQIQHLIIGSGVMGLSLASKLTQVSNSVLVIDKNRFLAEECSSRHSEVIHAGLYYPPESMKTKFCLRGKQLLYEYCERYHIPYKRIGKWIIGNQPNSETYLEKLLEKGKQFGIELRFLTQKEKESQPAVKQELHVLFSPSTGILDSHRFLQSLEGQILEAGGLIQLQTKLLDLQYHSNHSFPFKAQIESLKTKERFQIECRNVYNCAGLWSDQVSNLLLPTREKIVPVKGYYYTFPNHLKLSTLLYPMPHSNLKGLGIHCTLGLNPSVVRVGPNAEMAKHKEDYDVDLPGTDLELERRKKFWAALQSYLNLPDSYFDLLQVDYAGIRPKLSDQEFRDFIIRHEPAFPGFFNFLGIESPGFTSALAIAEYVVNEYKDIIK